MTFTSLRLKYFPSLGSRDGFANVGSNTVLLTLGEMTSKSSFVVESLEDESVAGVRSWQQEGSESGRLGVNSSCRAR